MSETCCSRVADSQPIMISGVYRSGTTFLSALVGAHSLFRASSSTVKFLRFCHDRYDEINLLENRRRLVTDTQRRIKVRWDIDIDSEAILAEAQECPDLSYACLYDIIMRQMLTDRPEQRWVEKLAVQWRDIPVFLDMFPRGKVLHIFRDVRDVTASYKNMTFEPGFTYLDAAFNFIDANQTLASLDKDYGDRVRVVKAEEIAADPSGQTRAICDFLEVNFEPQMLDFRKLNATGEDWASNTSYEVPYQNLPDGKPRWPEQLSRSEVIFLEMVSQPYLNDLGYVASDYFPSADDWSDIYRYIEDPVLKERFIGWLTKGEGAQGYRTDPYTHEMALVFPERYGSNVMEE